MATGSNSEVVTSVSSILRDTVTTADRDTVRRIVTRTGFFRDDEIEIAVELVDERLLKGELSGYHFLLFERSGVVVGYACYGPIGCTVGSFDLYWIAVDPECQGQGIGRRLIDEVERRIRNIGGRRIYIETSGRPEYAPTRAFYRSCSYEVVAVLPDFYDRGDDKVVWCRAC